MLKSTGIKIVAIVSLLGLYLTASAEMSSDNYQIPAAVMSSGGGSGDSASYSNTSTVGQPSALMGPEGPPMSNSYDIYPGYFYTLLSLYCPADMDKDGDVDGFDVFLYLPDTSIMNMLDFATDFGGLCP